MMPDVKALGCSESQRQMLQQFSCNETDGDRETGVGIEVSQQHGRTGGEWLASEERVWMRIACVSSVLFGDTPHGPRYQAWYSFAARVGLMTMGKAAVRARGGGRNG